MYVDRGAGSAQNESWYQTGIKKVHIGRVGTKRSDEDHRRSHFRQSENWVKKQPHYARG